MLAAPRAHPRWHPSPNTRAVLPPSLFACTCHVSFTAVHARCACFPPLCLQLKWMTATVVTLAVPSTLAWASFLSAMPELSVALGVLGAVGAGGVHWYGLKVQRQHADYIIGRDFLARVPPQRAGFGSLVHL